jgi:GNAT superfamily N-acetyltransferase
VADIAFCGVVAKFCTLELEKHYSARGFVVEAGADARCEIETGNLRFKRLLSDLSEPEVRAIELDALVNPAEIEIREPRSPEEMESYYDLRWRILREPWSQERGGERDEHEEEAIHLSAWAEGRLIGVGRAHFVGPQEAQIRYMAVESFFRKRGVGAAILHELEKRAQARGAHRIVLNARENALSFYQELGYAVIGRSELLFSIPHWVMQKILRP